MDQSDTPTRCMKDRMCPFERDARLCVKKSGHPGPHLDLYGIWEAQDDSKPAVEEAQG